MMIGYNYVWSIGALCITIAASAQGVEYKIFGYNANIALLFAGLCIFIADLILRSNTLRVLRSVVYLPVMLIFLAICSIFLSMGIKIDEQYAQAHSKVAVSTFIIFMSIVTYRDPQQRLLALIKIILKVGICLSILTICQGIFAHFSVFLFHEANPIYRIPQTIFGLNTVRCSGLMDDPNTQAFFLSLAAGSTFFLQSVRPSYLKTTMGILLIGAAILFTGSRMGWLICLALPNIYYLCRVTYKNTYLRFVSFLLCLGGASSLGFVLLNINGRSLDDHSSEQRIGILQFYLSEIWKTAHLLPGPPMEMFRRMTNIFITPYVTHNSILDFIVYYGLMPGLIILSNIAYIACIAFSRKPESIPLILSILAFWATLSLHAYTIFAVTFSIILAISYLCKKERIPANIPDYEDMMLTQLS